MTEKCHLCDVVFNRKLSHNSMKHQMARGIVYSYVFELHDLSIRESLIG